MGRVVFRGIAGIQYAAGDAVPRKSRGELFVIVITFATFGMATLTNLASVVKEAKDEEIQVPKSNDFFESKAFRLLTLVLYMGGVSGMGLTLAVYYLFIWDSRMPPLPIFKHTHPIG